VDEYRSKKNHLVLENTKLDGEKNDLAGFMAQLEEQKNAVTAEKDSLI